MKPLSRSLVAVLFASCLTEAEAVLVYWIDAGANTLTISGSASGTVDSGGVEWVFETGDSGSSASQLSLISGSFSPVVDVLAFSEGGNTDAFFVGSELPNGNETFVVSDAVYSYDSLPSGVEAFIEGPMLGNDIPLISGTGFGDIVYIPEPGSTMLLGLAVLGVFRRRR